VVSGRLSRLTPDDGDPDTEAEEQVLIEDWCQQYPSHSIGTLEHDSTGALWASGGDGASFTFADYGQDGNPLNPCGDPPQPVGGTQTRPTAEGGALRAQDLRTSGDPVTLDGTVIRINDVTGAGLPGNPLAANPDANAKRIVANGLRNPFRFTISNENELYVGDVGWNVWEEINRFPMGAASVTNFGWPCYEGNNSGTSAQQPDYDNPPVLSICAGLYGSPGAVTAPMFAYDHGAALGAGCEAGSSSIAGLEFYNGGAFPAAYNDALFFADYSRDCIWTMTSGVDGRPDPATLAVFQPTAANPVNLDSGPGGALYYPDFDGGTVRKIFAANATVTSAGGNITYTAATGKANSVVVDDPGSNYTFAESDIAAGAGCTQTNANLVTCADSGVNTVTMNLGDTADTADASGSSQDIFTINAGSGNDTVTGSALNDTLNGDNNNDTLNGGPGNDDINGGTDTGNDRMEGGEGDDDFDGGPGIDRVTYLAGCSSSVSIDLDNTADDNGCMSASDDADNVRDSVESITGSNLGDTIVGSCVANTIVGDAGTTNDSPGANDTLRGDPSAGCTAALGSGDFLGGGEGSDTFDGDGTIDGTHFAGLDTVTYGTPYSSFAAGISVDLDDNADDNDGFGNTTENLFGDIERVIGSPLADTINASAADQGVQLFGRALNDTLTGSSFGDHLDGEAGSDTLNCGLGTDSYRHDGSGPAPVGCETQL
jgi:glucose/arabinose dehydrogenase